MTVSISVGKMYKLHGSPVVEMPFYTSVVKHCFFRTHFLTMVTQHDHGSPDSVSCVLTI